MLRGRGGGRILEDVRIKPRYKDLLPGSAFSAVSTIFPTSPLSSTRPRYAFFSGQKVHVWLMSTSKFSCLLQTLKTRCPHVHWGHFRNAFSACFGIPVPKVDSNTRDIYALLPCVAIPGFCSRPHINIDGCSLLSLYNLFLFLACASDDVRLYQGPGKQIEAAT